MEVEPRSHDFSGYIAADIIMYAGVRVTYPQLT